MRSVRPRSRAVFSCCCCQWRWWWWRWHDDDAWWRWHTQTSVGGNCRSVMYCCRRQSKRKGRDEKKRLSWINQLPSNMKRFYSDWWRSFDFHPYLHHLRVDIRRTNNNILHLWKCYTVFGRIKSCSIFTARRYASAVLAVVVCLSVRVSVSLSQVGIVSKRLQMYIRTCRITQITSHDSAGTLIFLAPKTFSKFERGHHQRERQMQVG